MSADLFSTAEPRLAEALGLPRKAIKTVRTDHLEQGAHWDYSPAGAVCFSRAGIETALKHLSIPAEKIAALLPPPSGEAPAAPAATPADMALIETITTRNAALLLGATPADSPPNDPPPGVPPAPPAGDSEPPLDLAEPDVVEVTVTRCYTINTKLVGGRIGEAEVRVRVKSNKKLRPGMVLRCQCVEDDLYELAERLPRWPGKR